MDGSNPKTSSMAAVLIVTQAVLYMEFEVVEKLSAIYDVHELYKDQLHSTLKSLSSINFHLEDRLLSQLQVFMHNLAAVLQLEKGLLELCREFLELGPVDNAE